MPTGPSFTFQEKTPSKRGLFGRLGIWLLLSIIFLLLVLGIWAGGFLLKSVFASRQEAIIKERDALVPQWSRALERDILRLPSQVAFAEKLTEEHIYGSRVFDFLRAYTLKRVSIASVSTSRVKGGNKFKASGEAADFRVLAEQIVLLKSLKEIAQLTISEVGLGERSSVKFTFTMEVTPAFFAAALER